MGDAVLPPLFVQEFKDVRMEAMSRCVKFAVSGLCSVLVIVMGDFMVMESIVITRLCNHLTLVFMLVTSFFMFI